MIALLVAAALSCPPGTSLPELVAVIENSGGTFIDLVDVNGQGFDQVIIAEYGKHIAVGRINHGCSVSGPVPLGPSTERIGV